MFNRFSKTFFTVISAVTHFSMLCLLIAIPVFLVFQGEKEPEFRVYSTEIESAAGDSTLASKGISGDGWCRITYNCSATSGKFSPYTYSIEYFDLVSIGTYVKDGTCFIGDNGPFEVPGGDDTDFSLTVYIQGSETDAHTVADSAYFSTRKVTKGFSMIKKELNFIMPGFSVADCLTDAQIGG